MTLSERIERAQSLLARCELCERRCGADRTRGQVGWCDVPDQTRCFREYLSLAEEIELIPSHTIYLSGCNMRCAYCIVGPWVDQPDREPSRPLLELAAIAEGRRAEGARNVHFLGGEPTVHLCDILRFVEGLSFQPHVVWNSNMFFTADTAEILDGFVDTYVADLRYGNDACAQELSDVREYTEIALRNLKFAAASVRTIVRLLLLPGHIDCCFRLAAEWLAKELPRVPANIMTQYLPAHRAAELPEIGRTLTESEIARATGIARSLALELVDAGAQPGPQPGSRPVATDAEVTITIDHQGRVYFQNCSPDILRLALAVAPQDAELKARAMTAGLLQGG